MNSFPAKSRRTTAWRRRRTGAELWIAALLLVLQASLLPGTSRAQSTAPPDVIAKALPTAKPGDVLVIADGTYENQLLELRGRGSSERPVVVRAETPGGVIFSGRSALSIEGEQLVVEGLLFTDGHAAEKEVISLSGKTAPCGTAPSTATIPPPTNRHAKRSGWRCADSIIASNTARFTTRPPRR